MPGAVGRYVPVRLVGTGSSAHIYAAWDPAREVRVAIKVPASHCDGAAREKRCPLQEARLLCRVQHPHVIAVHDSGVLEDGRPYFVMDLAQGGSVADRIAMRLAPDAHFVSRLANALAGGLGVLHGHGIVHRDVTPANVLLLNSFDAPDHFALADFGLAADLQPTDGVRPQRRPCAQTLSGSSGSCAPEELDVVRGVGPHTDAFGATALLWSVMTGCPPPAPRHLRWVLDGVDERWRAVISSGLAPDPSLRPSSMAEWHDGVERALTAGLVTARWVSP